ncbi:MAG: MBL fold metallo-hydrolase, partial [Candidatus Lokiarchaeota archaeon]|nr:MBL fold metallo-hydrolase [Candidatus Lokiarchaeota archaeon]
MIIFQHPPAITPVPLGITRCFLLKGREGFVLVDTSYPNQYPRFKAVLDKKLGISVKEIKWVILTHHHDDHAGFIAPLLEESGARLVVHELALPHLEKGVSLDDDPSYYISRRARWLFKAMERFHPFTFPPVVPSAGDVVMRGTGQLDLDRAVGLPGRAVHTPGHSSDSISVLLEGGTLLCGDTF